MAIRSSFNRNSLLSLLKSYLFFVLDSEFYWFFVLENPLYLVWVKIFPAKGASHQSLQSHPLSHHRIRQGLKMGSVSGSNVDINLWSNFSVKLTDSLTQIAKLNKFTKFQFFHSKVFYGDNYWSPIITSKNSSEILSYHNTCVFFVFKTKCELKCQNELFL